MSGGRSPRGGRVDHVAEHHPKPVRPLRTQGSVVAGNRMHGARSLVVGAVFEQQRPKLHLLRPRLGNKKFLFRFPTIGDWALGVKENATGGSGGSRQGSSRWRAKCGGRSGGGEDFARRLLESKGLLPTAGRLTDVRPGQDRWVAGVGPVFVPRIFADEVGKDLSRRFGTYLDGDPSLSHCSRGQMRTFPSLMRRLYSMSPSCTSTSRNRRWIVLSRVPSAMSF